MSKVIPSNRVQAGFTLLELLIVILLISIFYYLVSASFGQEKKKNTTILTIKNIRRYPMMSKIPKNGAELICLNDCQECYIYNRDSYKFTKINSSLPKLKAYIINNNNETIKVDFGRYHDKPICLRFNYYPNGSTSEMILFDNDIYYYIPTYFGEIESFSSLSDAIDRYRWVEGKFTDKSDYY